MLCEIEAIALKKQQPTRKAPGMPGAFYHNRKAPGIRGAFRVTGHRAKSPLRKISTSPVSVVPQSSCQGVPIMKSMGWWNH